MPLNKTNKQNNIIMQLAKVWTAIEKLSIIWKSDLSDKIKLISSKQRSCQFYYMDAPLIKCT